MVHIFNYIKTNWFLCLMGGAFLGWFTYLTYAGNQVCDCEKTETYRDGTTRSHSSGRGFYRFYHK
ncbi:hypothetical protein [Chryseobacterium polytrichastri]|uniref:Uncharacterized protein n=1 Tax=Chryseobacterium polytrichastri TaxID=1302687 RepID=A0A1M7JKU9_9FLAO|nr:hypothetical protein [Chryseobacterium polytrichastri]SHM53531.1 hypothetical protein SAMN05444267_105316 [Chryseobacterium polytrichastri]